CRNTVQMPLRTPVAATARCTSLVTSSVPRPLVRKSSVCCPITSLLLESPYEIGARLAGLHQQREIRARQDQLPAHVAMPLQQLRRIHPAHARELAVLAAGGDNFGIRLADPRVVELAGDSHLEAQVVRADQQRADSRDR